MLRPHFTGKEYLLFRNFMDSYKQKRHTFDSLAGQVILNKQHNSFVLLGHKFF